LAITLINRQQISAAHFVEREGGVVEFTEADANWSSGLSGSKQIVSHIRYWNRTFVLPNAIHTSAHPGASSA